MPNNSLSINCNNQRVITLTKDNKFHVYTKHIDVHYLFIHKAIKDRKIVVQYIPTNDNVSDIFTKLLMKVKNQQLVELLGLCAITCKV